MLCGEDGKIAMLRQAVLATLMIATAGAALLAQGSAVLATYRAHPGAQLQLSGNTDRSGSVIINREAGLRRAETVRAQMISVTSNGEERPLVPTEDGVREVQNRRVEIAVGGLEP